MSSPTDMHIYPYIVQFFTEKLFSFKKNAFLCSAKLTTILIYSFKKLKLCQKLLKELGISSLIN
jgi:hypothetical protein